MKKLTRKLLISVLSVALALVALGTQTFAWFAMNDTVTASGMSVTVKSDQMFLLIQAGDHTADEIQASKLLADTAVTSSAVLLPAANDLTNSATTSTVEATSGADLASWYYRASSDPDHYLGSSASAETAIAVAKKGEYILINEFSLTVADGSNDLANLKVDHVTIAKAGGDFAVKVLVAGTNGCEEFDEDGGAGSVVLRTDNLTDTTVEKVKIYIYWDGNDTDVYTNGIADLQNTTVTVTFTGETVVE